MLLQWRWWKLTSINSRSASAWHQRMLCVLEALNTLVWVSGPFLCYRTGCWTPESRLFRMSAQEIILPECYKGQGNTILHFSFLHVEWWIKNSILFVSYRKSKKYMLGQILPGLKMALLQLPAVKPEHHISLDEPVLHICYDKIQK